MAYQSIHTGADIDIGITRALELPSTDTGKGASQVGIEDKEGKFEAINVEDALLEARNIIDTNITDIADRYAKQEAVRKFALLEEKTGNSVQIADTIAAPFAELEILGETLATPTDPEQEVSPDNPQTLTSLTSFDLTVSNADGSETITVNVPLRDTSNNQLEARGIVATWNADGTPASFSAQAVIFKDTDGKWKLRSAFVVKTYNGSEGWTSGGAYGGAYRYYKSESSMANGLSHSVISIAADSIPAVTRNSLSSTSFVWGVSTASNGYTNIKAPFATTAELQAHLALHPLTVIFPSNTVTVTELSAADQTALNEAEAAGTFAGITNIMLSTEIGQVHVKAAKDITAVIADMASAIALLG